MYTILLVLSLTLSLPLSKRQTVNHAKRLFLVFDFSPLVLYTLGYNNNNNNNNNNIREFQW